LSSMAPTGIPAMAAAARAKADRRTLAMSIIAVADRAVHVLPATSPEISGNDACNADQAASAPEALAAWVAIASISAGDRQS
jgi:hypothetical protein